MFRGPRQEVRPTTSPGMTERVNLGMSRSKRTVATGILVQLWISDGR